MLCVHDAQAKRTAMWTLSEPYSDSLARKSEYQGLLLFFLSVLISAENADLSG